MMFLIVFSLLLFSYAAFHEQDIIKIRQIMTSSQNVLADAQQNIFIKELDNIVSDLHFLYEEPVFQTYINNNLAPTNTENEWISFSNNMKKYDQLRYIDQNGDEHIRINFVNGRALKTNGTSLQNKSDRYYFRDTMKLNNEQIYLSKFDLNIEKNILEFPIKPMLRIALPVYDKTKTKRGILITNYMAKFILQDVKNSNRPNEHVQLINEEGYWLAGPDSEKEWAFMYPERSEITFKKQFPKEWEIIETGKNGQFFTPNGLFTFRTIYPADQICFNPTIGENDFRINSSTAALFLILQIPATTEPYANNRDSYILAITTLFNSFYLIFGIITLSLLAAILFGLHMEETQKIKDLATYDALTGCLNRVHGIGIINAAMLSSDRYKTPLSLIIMDLDHFKKVNDTWGHPVGDEVLKKVAEVTRNNIRATDQLIRLGGEEFIIFSPENNIDGAVVLAEKIRTALEKTIHPSAGKVTVSLGVAERMPTESFTLWYERADTALYQAKETGRNRFAKA